LPRSHCQLARARDVRYCPTPHPTPTHSSALTTPKLNPPPHPSIKQEVITISKDKLPGYDEKIKMFYEEHIHNDEEIRWGLGLGLGWGLGFGV